MTTPKVSTCTNTPLCTHTHAPLHAHPHRSNQGASQSSTQCVLSTLWPLNGVVQGRRPYPRVTQPSKSTSAVLCPFLWPRWWDSLAPVPSPEHAQACTSLLLQQRGPQPVASHLPLDLHRRHSGPPQGHPGGHRCPAATRTPKPWSKEQGRTRLQSRNQFRTETKGGEGCVCAGGQEGAAHRSICPQGWADIG